MIELITDHNISLTEDACLVLALKITNIRSMFIISNLVLSILEIRRNDKYRYFILSNTTYKRHVLKSQCHGSPYGCTLLPYQSRYQRSCGLPLNFGGTGIPVGWPKLYGVKSVIKTLCLQMHGCQSVDGTTATSNGANKYE